VTDDSTWRLSKDTDATYTKISLKTASSNSTNVACRTRLQHVLQRQSDRLPTFAHGLGGSALTSCMHA